MREWLDNELEAGNKDLFCKYVVDHNDYTCSLHLLMIGCGLQAIQQLHTVLISYY